MYHRTEILTVAFRDIACNLPEYKTLAKANVSSRDVVGLVPESQQFKLK